MDETLCAWHLPRQRRRGGHIQGLYQQGAHPVLAGGLRAVHPLGSRRLQASAAQDSLLLSVAQLDPRGEGVRPQGSCVVNHVVPPRRREHERHHRWSGTELCGLQQHQHSVSQRTVWHAAQGRQGPRQCSIHPHTSWRHGTQDLPPRRRQHSREPC